VKSVTRRIYVRFFGLVNERGVKAREFLACIECFLECGDDCPVIGRVDCPGVEQQTAVLQPTGDRGCPRAERPRQLPE
jgi:hypothetical protein